MRNVQGYINVDNVDDLLRLWHFYDRGSRVEVKDWLRYVCALIGLIEAEIRRNDEVDSCASEQLSTGGGTLANDQTSGYGIAGLLCDGTNGKTSA